ncbi:MAG: thioredoxin family protein [Planctomycetales bacterium]|nr:thioredoxin family protein [Planctomycetales bacterium]
MNHCGPAAVAADSGDDTNVWSDDYLQTMAAARSDSKPRPVLIKYEASWCGPCRVLAEHFERPAVIRTLDGWRMIRIDVDKAPAGVPLDNVSALPTIRVLDPRGTVIAEQVGLLQEDELIQWLRTARDDFDQSVRRSELTRVLGSGTIGDAQTNVLLQMLSDRDVGARVSAAAMIIEHPKRFAKPVTGLFVDGTLVTKLTCLDILRRWTAPADGIDPWSAEAISPERIEMLQQWASSAESVDDESTLFSPMEKTFGDEMTLELDRLTSAGKPREGLLEGFVTAGPDFLPTVRDRLSLETSDQSRQRLRTVHLGMLADPSLSFRHTNLPSRLASLDVDERRAAAKELSGSALPQDFDLLEALFGHSDPLVREFALKGMESAGGGQATRLTKLLEDPDKNVRAAVLKVWLDHPVADVLPAASRYALQETDSDLLVYVVKLFKELKSTAPEAIEALVKLSEHKDWQVRAEVAAMIAKLTEDDDSYMSQMTGDSPIIPEKIREVSRQLLRDNDSFVLSQIVPAAIAMDQSGSMDQLIDIAWKHPEIRENILPNLTEKPTEEKLQFLVSLYDSNDTKDRIFAIEALDQFDAPLLHTILPNALGEDEIEVRRTAASALISWLDNYHSKLDVIPPKSDEQAEYEVQMGMSDGSFFSYDEEIIIGDSEPSSPGIFGGVFDALFGSSKPSESGDDTDAGEQSSTGGDLPGADVERLEAERSIDEFPDNEFEMLDEAGSESPDATEMAENADRYEQWLTGWRLAPQMEVPWLEGVVENLVEAKNSHGDETGMITLALVRLGQPFEVDAIISAAESSQSKTTLLDVFPWLPRVERGNLVVAAATADHAGNLIPELIGLAERYNPGESTELLWQTLEVLPISSIHYGYGMTEALTKALTGQEQIGWYGDEEPGKAGYANEIIEHFDRLQTTGGQFVALSVLSSLDASRVPELVGQKFNDVDTEVSLRRDWARFALATRPYAEAIELANQLVDDPDLRTVAVQFFCSQYVNVSNTENGWISIRSGGNAPRLPGLLDIALLPRQIDLEKIRPLLDSDDEQVAAMATYLFVMLDQPVDLQPLKLAADKEPDVQYLPEMTTLLIYAIAHRDEDDDVHLLEKIFDAMPEDSRYSVREFYWKIRIMSGPNALKLRKRIRDEVGLEALM